MNSEIPHALKDIEIELEMIENRAKLINTHEGTGILNHVAIIRKYCSSLFNLVSYELERNK